MSLLRILVRDRRVWLLALLAGLTLVVSRYSLPPDAAVKTVVKGGYWALLVVLGYFGFALARVIRETWRERRWGRVDAAVLAMILAAGSVLLAHERYGYKILADELLLAGTSMGMHYERDVAYPVRGTDVQGPFQITQNVIDKRPFFYPFLVALAHDLTGYRPANAFYVNTALGFVFLGLVFVLGWRIARSRWAGAFLVLLFAGLPLLSQQMKGGGFDLLNLVMLTVVLLLAIRYAERRDVVTLEALGAAAVLLAFTRYESVLVLLPVATLVGWGWWRDQRVVLTAPLMVAPVFLLFPLLQNRVFSLNAGAWELASRPGSDVPFALHYVPDNLGHALAFFFDTTGYQPNSPLFALIGLLAIAFFLLWIVRSLRTPMTTPPAEVAVAVVGCGLLGLAVLLMLYFWGQFDHPVIHRLSLPVHLLMAVAIAAVGASLTRSPRWWQAGCAVAVIGLVVYSLPVMARRAYAANYSPALEMEWRTEFLRRFPERDYLFLDNDSVFWITHRVAATPAVQARERKEGLIYHLRNGTFSAMYVMQHYRIDPETGTRRLEPTDDVGPDFELEPVWERRIQTLFIGRISRVKAIRQDGREAARAGLAVTPPGTAAPATRSAEEWEAAKKAYVDHWLKQLP
ncbi:hypothetical protein [Opitutus sp. ER46]|uniref:hypothetical protein n=1 Tax=Opitutus sp. ER46 TaxID=2161864 RepID=UPI000D3128E0|nr:hypothetical protein [Opitutus sp. ER46]PTX95541.1 hypothetical protein DB354_08960 [Opitutus sp. ER46]